MVKTTEMKLEELMRILAVANETYKKRKILVKHEEELQLLKQNLEQQAVKLAKLDTSLANWKKINVDKVTNSMNEAREEILEDIINLQIKIDSQEQRVAAEKESIYNEEKDYSFIALYLRGRHISEDELKEIDLEVLLYFMWATKIRVDEIITEPPIFYNLVKTNSQISNEEMIIKSLKDLTIYLKQFKEIFL
jgi:hypothetical protein